MKKLNFGEMEIINGGQIVSSSAGSAYAIDSSSVTSALDPVDVDGQRLNWCFIGRGITGIGGGIVLLGGTFTCGIAAAVYVTIAAGTVMYC